MITFEKYGFSLNLIKSINKLSFKTPTPIQQKVIPKILSSEIDIIATAQTGTGKTAAFGMPIIELTNNKSKNIECVILCPTRELCLQITKDLNSYSEYIKGYEVLPIYGGSKIETQIKGLKKFPKVVVCTPGRLNDLIKRRRIKLGFVKHFVLDEADEMLSMGFKSEIDKILEEVPEERRIYLFSATISQKVKKVTQMYMKDAMMISTASANQGSDNVRHVFYTSKKNKRYEIIKNIIDINSNIYSIVFCRTRRETKEVADKLIRDNYRAQVLNGDLSQAERDRVMKQFRTKKINVLVATDVASRGIDVDSLSHIINYNLPDDPEVYVHRSGRTGRAGNNGVSIVLITKKEYYRLKEIEKLSKISFKEENPPTDTDILNSRINSFTENLLKAQSPGKEDRSIFNDLYSKLSMLTKDEIIGKIISLNFDKPKNYKASIEDKKESHKKKNTQLDRGMTKLTINVGKSEKITPEVLIRLINKTIRSRNTEIGKIQIKNKFSTFEVDPKIKTLIISRMKHIRYNRKRIIVSSFGASEVSNRTKKKKKRF